MTPLQRLMALFVGNDSHHGTHGEPSPDPNGGAKLSIRGSAKTIKTGATEQHWEDHVAGVRPLGVVPITKENVTSWGSIDYDVYDEDITEVIAKADAAKFPLVPCRSKSGGLHLFLFATEPVDARRMQDALRELAAALGLAGSEIFPKQASLLSDRGDQGSWMIMPYYGGDFGGKLHMQHGLKRNGADMTLAEFVRHADKMKQTPDEILAMTVRSAKPGKKQMNGKKPGKKRAGPDDDETVDFGDGPPCLVHLTTQEGGIKQGGQNNTLFHMGVYFKKKYPDDWQKKLEEANHKYMRPPHPTSGIDSIIKSLNSKEYQYKCKDQPMASHCDAILCRRKRFGVGGGGVAPIINSIKKMNSDPPVWFLEVETIKIECSTEDLQRWDRFQRHLIDKLHNPFGVMPQAAWLAIIQEAMMHEVEIIEAGTNAKTEFRELMEIYLTSRQRGTKEEDLLSGRPWEDEEAGKHYFQLMRLMKFLEREGMRNIKRGTIVSKIRELGGGWAGKNIKGHFNNYHWIPSKALQALPEVDPPKLIERPI